MIKFGNNSIGSIYFGSNPIGKAYLGSNLVYQKGSSPLPSGLTLVDYIETDGTAYIDTGIKGNIPKSAELNVVPLIPESGNNYVMGCRKDSGNTRLIHFLVNANGYCGFSYAGDINNSTTTGIDCTASATNKSLMLVRCALYSGNQYFGIRQAGESSFTTRHTTNSATITDNPYNIAIFGVDSHGTIIPAKSGTRIQRAKMWNAAGYTDNLVFDGEACLYNGEYGLWDYVTNTFFGNAAGSGAFSGPSNL